MNIKDLLFQRVLLAEKTGSYGSQSIVTEMKILEVAPSGNFIKVQDMHGRKYWRAKTDIQPIEILENIETARDKK